MASCNTIIYFTTRMTELADFYRRGLDLGKPQSHGGNHLGFRLAGGVYLGFDQVDEARPGFGGPTVWFAVDDLQATFDRFVVLGAAVRYPPVLKPMGDVLASLHDLDGNVFGLVER
jgi:predicted enzyme related to lactoylglutathione lyase